MSTACDRAEVVWEKNCHPALTFARQLFKIPGDRRVARLAPGTFVPTRRTGASRPTQHRSKQTLFEEGEMMAPDNIISFASPKLRLKEVTTSSAGGALVAFDNQQHFETASSDLSVGS
jgi:hypothetical protein